MPLVGLTIGDLLCHAFLILYFYKWKFCARRKVLFVGNFSLFFIRRGGRGWTLFDFCSRKARRLFDIFYLHYTSAFSSFSILPTWAHSLPVLVYYILGLEGVVLHSVPAAVYSDLF
jgi:hypothetical protein